MRAVVCGAFAVAFAVPAVAGVPETVKITCDVERRAFRNAAKVEPEVTFRLYDQENGGNQIGSDYVVPMKDLVAEKIKPERYDTVKRKTYARIEAVVGPPVDLDSATGELWLEVQVGSEIMTCDEGKRVKFPSVAPPARRKLESVAFAKGAEEAERTRDISARVYNDSPLTISGDGNTNWLTFNQERWDTADIFDPAQPYQLTAPVTGKYFIFANVLWDQNTGGIYRSLSINTHYETIAEVTGPAVTLFGVQTTQHVGTVWQLDAGEYVKFAVSQETTGQAPVDIEVAPVRSPEAGMVKLP